MLNGWHMERAVTTAWHAGMPRRIRPPIPQEKRGAALIFFCIPTLSQNLTAKPEAPEGAPEK